MNIKPSLQYQSLISKIFTIPYFDKLVDQAFLPDSFSKCVDCYVKEKKNLTYGSAIRQIYEYMDCDYRNEYYFKNAVINQLLIQKHDKNITTAFRELPIAGARADMVLINGKGIVYEIKTDLDSFDKLDHQIRDYYKVFSYVYVVAGRRHVDFLKTKLKSSKVGIYELSDNGRLVCRKKAACNRQYLSYEKLFLMLRKKEFESIIMNHFGELPQVNSFLYYRECLKRVEMINITTLQDDVLCELKKRHSIESQDCFDLIPKELAFYVYFSNRYRSDYNGLIRFLNKKVEV